MQSESGTLLVEGGVVTESQLQQALSAAVRNGGTLIQNLIRLGFATDGLLASFFAGRLQIPLAEGAQLENLPAFITRLVPVDVVIVHRTVPIMLHQGVLHMAMSDPTNRSALEEISFITGYSASPVAAPDALVEAAMARYYGITPDDTAPVSQPPPAAKAVAADDPTANGGSTEAPEPPAPSGTFDHAPPTRDAPQTQSGEPEARVDTEGENHVEAILLTQPTSSAPEPAASITDAIRLQVAREQVQGAPDDNFEAIASATHFGVPQDRSPLPSATDPRVADDRPSAHLPEATLEPLADSERARRMILRADDRDEVARVLVRYASAFMPRVVLFVAKKDLLVGWMGSGPGLNNRQIKGIMIPLASASVFRTVRETGTDYFGSLPRTTVNDTFLTALGEARPKQILLIPVTVRHKPICVLYGDCWTDPGFSKDLSGVHLIAQDASSAFEKIILERKISRLGPG